MKNGKWKAVRRVAVLLAALTLPLMGPGARGEEVADTPPTVIWLGGGYDIATYLGNGVVEMGRIDILQVKGGLRQTLITYIDLNGEVVGLPLQKWIELPSKDYMHVTRQGGVFHGGYMAVHGATTGSGNVVIDRWGLIDPAGNFVVPIEYATEEEAWAQVGLSVPELPDDYFPPVENMDRLYGFQGEDGELLVDYQFIWATPFEGRMYTQVQSDDQIGLLKDPRMKDTISPWAEPEVSAALKAGLVPSRCAGYYTFEITRSQMAALLVRYTELALGKELPLPEEHPFTDTQDGYIEKAYAAGIVQGAGEGIFNPDKVVTREQLATMLYRTIIGFVAPGWGENDPLPTEYTDFDQVSDWAQEAVSVLLAQGVMQGVSETQISPKTFCTTEQAILLVYRLATGGQP